MPEETELLIRGVIGAAIEVHRLLGPGYIESIYERALCHELDLRGIRHERRMEIVVPFKDIQIPGQRIDMIVDNRLILELKAVEAIAPIHEAKLLSYMKTLNIRAGLIVNFHETQLKKGLRRFVL